MASLSKSRRRRMSDSSSLQLTDGGSSTSTSDPPSRSERESFSPPKRISRSALPSRFQGHIFSTSNGTRWQILEPLSRVKYQQEVPPCEATQVFDCVSMDNSGDAVEEAVVKVKFQIQAAEKTLGLCKADAASWEESTKHCTTEQAERSLATARETLHVCTHPSVQPNTMTTDEIRALDYFAEAQCEHAPWYLDNICYTVQPGTDPREIVGGFLLFLLMTKRPGEALNYPDYWSKTLAERDAIRAAFKTALLAIWDCGIEPVDAALRNILWDKEERKCYIVDFEDVDFIDDDGGRDPKWTDDQYEYWGLTKDRFSSDESMPKR